MYEMGIEEWKGGPSLYVGLGCQYGERTARKSVSVAENPSPRLSDRSALNVPIDWTELTGDGFLSDRSNRILAGSISYEYKYSLN